MFQQLLLARLGQFLGNIFEKLEKLGMNHRTNIDDSRDRRRRAHVARRPSKAHFRGSLWTVTRSRQNSRRHLRAAKQFRRGWCPQLMSSSCDWLMSEMFGRFPQPFRSMSTPEAFPYDPQLPRCLCTCETHPGAMHAHSAPGGLSLIHI